MNKPVFLADSESLRCLDSPPAKAAAEKGFSLIEVLFAAGLISFLLAGTAELLMTSIEIDRVSDRSVRLAGVLASELDAFKALPFEASELLPGPGEIVLQPDPDGPSIRIAWSVAAVSENLKKVSFSLSREGASGRPLEAVLLITRELCGR